MEIFLSPDFFFHLRDNETIAYDIVANLCHTVNILNFKHFSLSVLK